jgi:hypothetical protein
MPDFERTAEQREIVYQGLYKASGFGLPHTDICHLVINPRTGTGAVRAFRQRA